MHCVDDKTADHGKINFQKRAGIRVVVNVVVNSVAVGFVVIDEESSVCSRFSVQIVERYKYLLLLSFLVLGRPFLTWLFFFSFTKMTYAPF